MARGRGARVVLALCISCGAATAGAAPQLPAAAEEADHQSLRQMKAAYEEAVRADHIEALAPYFHADFHGVMVTGRPVNSFADIQQYWRDIRELIGARGSYTTTLNPERSIIAGDVALARGTTTDVVKTDQGQEFHFTTLWTATLQRDGGTWKIRSVQGTMDPIDNPFVREFTKRALLRVGAAAAAIGLGLGGVLGILWQRRRGA